MPRCAVAGCTRPLWWRGRRLARQVTDLDTHFPALEQLRTTARRRADDCIERELRWTIGIGRGYRWHMHEAAHGDVFARSSLPSQEQLDDWCIEARRAATRVDGAPQR